MFTVTWCLLLPVECSFNARFKTPRRTVQSSPHYLSLEDLVFCLNSTRFKSRMCNLHAGMLRQRVTHKNRVIFIFRFNAYRSNKNGTRILILRRSREESRLDRDVLFRPDISEGPAAAAKLSANICDRTYEMHIRILT